MAQSAAEVQVRAVNSPVVENPPRVTRRILALALFFLTAAVCSISAQTTYMQDTPADTGVEPNPDTGPMYVSQDIWVRNSPDPGYQPYPFTEGSPPWTLPPHQNPVYRDPLQSTPNYIYVEVRNHSQTASTGTERLRVYWAKASTGLSWPTQWGGAGVDYQPGGFGTPLYDQRSPNRERTGRRRQPPQQRKPLM